MSRADCDQCDEEFAKLREQIATLKAICIKECAESFLEENWKDKVNASLLKMATSQLAREYPEIAWEEKK